MKFVCLVDCNNFFASCERLFRPDLLGHPVVVLSSNDGAIVARSNEVKELGVPMGVPYFKVRDILVANKAAVFSSNFELYRDISRRVVAVLKEEMNGVEQYSVDEAFFELNAKDKGTAEKRLKLLKAHIEKTVGVPVSIGAAPTMTIAKFASEKEKRGIGVCVMDQKAWLSHTKEVPLSEIWGVGGKTSQKLKDHNLITVDDLLRADIGRIEKIFGINGLRLRSELSGEVAKSVKSKDELPKSIMSTRSFSKTTTSLAFLEEALSYHVGQVAAELREKEAKAKVLRVLLGTSRHGDYFLQGGIEEVMLESPTNDTRVLLRAANILAKQIYKEDVPYKKAGVVVGGITPGYVIQSGLFETVADTGSEKLMSAIDSLNHKIKREAVTIGRIADRKNWDAKHEHRSPRFTTNWNELPKVKLSTSKNKK